MGDLCDEYDKSGKVNIQLIFYFGVFSNQANRKTYTALHFDND